MASASASAKVKSNDEVYFQFDVSMTMSNQTVDDMRYIRGCSWVGSFATFTNNIPGHGGVASFLHYGNIRPPPSMAGHSKVETGHPNVETVSMAGPPNVETGHPNVDSNSMGCLIFSITTPVGRPTAVILAWDAPIIFQPSALNRIYGVCDHRSSIDLLEWLDIRKALDNASTPSVDVTTDGVRMQATIVNNPDTKMADIVVNYGFSR